MTNGWAEVLIRFCVQGQRAGSNRYSISFDAFQIGGKTAQAPALCDGSTPQEMGTSCACRRHVCPLCWVGAESETLTCPRCETRRRRNRLRVPG
jgi:hypothetical protein